MNYEAVYRTALATQGLLIIEYKNIKYRKLINRQFISEFTILLQKLAEFASQKKFAYLNEWTVG